MTSILEDTPESYYRRAILAACKAMPLCAPALRTLNPIFTNSVETMAVDKYFRVYINEAFLLACVKAAENVSASNPCRTCSATAHHPIAYVAGVLSHEAWHCLRDHSDRAMRKNIQNKKELWAWRKAVDFEINDDLLEIFADGKDLPTKICFPQIALNFDPVNKKIIYTDDGILYIPSLEGFENNRLAEEYFYMLLEKQEECKTCDGTGKGDKKDGKGKDKDKGSGKDKNDNKEDGEENEHGEDEGHDHGDEGEPCPDCQGEDQNLDCGSGADGQEREYDEDAPSAAEGMAPGLTEVEARMLRKHIAKEIEKSAKARGNLPGGWLRWAETQLEKPKYNWRKELGKVFRYAFTKSSGDSIRSYHRIGRRSASLKYKVILPSTYTPKPRAVIVQDTSGSMDNEAIRIARSESEEIIKRAGLPVGYINCDMQFDKVQELHGSIKNAEVFGGGGTDMRVGITAAVKSRPRPDLIILFTDGYTPYPSEPLPHGIQLVVCLVGNHACEINEVPSWIHTVKIVGDDVEVK